MIQAICKALMHSLWQGLLFSIVTGLFMLYARRLTAAVRYLVLSGLFFSLLATCGATLLYELYSMSANPGGNEAAEGGDRMLLPIWYALNAFCTEHAAAIVLVWFLVFLFRSLQMAAGLAYSHRIKHSMTEPAPVYWRKKIRQLSRHLKIKKNVRLLESGIVNMPLVIGHLRPVIFIPLGLLTQLPEREIEAVLLHELAHIRRHDYFVNFVQQIAGNLLFFNPGLLWISALLREEREHCCDDIAIGYTGDKANFIRALVSFKQHTGQTGGLAVAFPSRRHQLLQRVLRIAHDRNKSLNTSEKWFFIGSCLVLAALLTSLHNPGSILRVAPVANHTSSISTRGPLNSQQEPGAATSGSSRETLTSPTVTVGPPTTEQGLPGMAKGTDIHTKQSPADAEQSDANTEQSDANTDLLAAVRERLTDAEKGQWDAKIQAERAARQSQIEDAERRRQEDVIRAEENIQRLQEDMKAKQEKFDADRVYLQKAKKEIERLNADDHQSERENIQLGRDDVQSDRNKLQKELNDLQAAKQAQQALRDREQALEDQKQSTMDKDQLSRDKQQASRDKEQSLKDKAQAAIDQFQGENDRLQMIKDQKSAGKQQPRIAQKN